MLSAAWYKGRFGFDGGFTDVCGDRMRMICGSPPDNGSRSEQ